MPADHRTLGIAPFFFGDPSRQLFGCYHAPARSVNRRTGVLLCYPVGPEYIRSHRAFRQLSIRLSQAGFGVLRYDHYGCGDSAGLFEDCRMANWLDGVPLAIHELRSKWSHSEVCVIGLTLGASISLLSTDRSEQLAGMVLWDLVIDGCAYVKDLNKWQAATLASGAIPQRPPSEFDGAHTEILGYPFSNNIIEDIRGIRPLESERVPSRKFLFLDTHEESRTGPMREHLRQLGASVAFQAADAPQTWRQEPYQAVIPNAVLTSMVNWIGGEFE